MGTIYYKTSDYITMGINTNNYDELDELERDFEMTCDYENGETILNDYDFYYYHITLEPGYYEGVSLNIENNFPVFYDDYNEKRDAQKEITNIKKMLLELAGVGFVACSPGWCTGYKDYNETKKAINEAIKDLRAEAAAIPTWNKYNNENY